MSEAITVEVLTQLLSRVPGASWSCRVDPLTGKSSWIYIDARAAEVYDVPEAELRTDPGLVVTRMVPEDRVKLDEAVAQSFQTLAPILWSGRIARRDGEVRWIETQTSVQREADGSLTLYGQVLDVTERKRFELLLAESEHARRRSDTLHRAVIDALPVGVVVLGLEGQVEIANAAQESLLGPIEGSLDDNTSAKYGIFRPDGTTPYPSEELPIAKAFRGEVVIDAEFVVRNSHSQSEARALGTARPLCDESGKQIATLLVCHDITTERALEKEVRARNDQLAASEEAKTALIERLRYSIDELSNPILEVWDDVLVMPIIGVVDSRRTADMVQRLLAEVTRTQASFVIVDLTGVEIVDTKTADHLIKLMRKVEIVGARCVLTGIRTAVAETLVDIGVDFGRITTLRNLKHGLREAIRFARRERDGARDLDTEADPSGELSTRQQSR